jgi:hypothetical protein
MTAVVFAGPSLHGEMLRPASGIEFRPPAAQGDVYRAVRDGFRVIAIIDGYFEGLPSVWHKEVLFALERGVGVYGASSMGALRAAELDTFGMVGIGRIYRWYRDGFVTDDAEVALVHGPAEAGFIPLSEPLVNVRATIDATRAAGLVDDGQARLLLDAAQRIYYADRSLDAVAEAAGLPHHTATLRDLRVDQKKRDALAMLSILADPAIGITAPAVGFQLERTIFWEAAVRSWGSIDPDVRTALDELRIADPECFSSLRREAMTAILLRREAVHRGLDAAPDELRSTVKQFRLARGLTTQAALEAWLADNGMNNKRMMRMMRDQVLQDAAARALGGLQLEEVMGDLLKVSGRYVTLLAEGRARPRVENGGGYPAPPPVLLSWFASRWTGGPPADVDSMVESLALDSRQALYSLIARAYLSSLDRNGD